MDKVNTINEFLHNQEMEKDYYIVRNTFSASNKIERFFGRQNNFNRNANEEMRREAQQYVSLTLQNLHFKNIVAHQEANPITAFEISVCLSTVTNGKREEKLLKTYTEKDKVYSLEF